MRRASKSGKGLQARQCRGARLAFRPSRAYRRGAMDPLPSSAPRLLVSSALAAGAVIPLDRAQNNYLVNVLRLKAGDAVLAFNGRDGEWRCAVEQVTRRDVALKVGERLRPQPPAGDLHYLFAPLKSARLDYLAQKAVEMGASVLQPVMTRRTQVSRVNLERLQANAVEAAEQCGILTLPEIRPEVKLERWLAARDPDRLLILCDEDAPVADPLAALARVKPGPLALLIGPEGGFDPAERRLLLAQPAVLRLSLGPRILRADTAAVAALAIVQSTLGDWASRDG
jgi:16S rRNA (uracil1498-N3)-methyltransferase